MGIICIHCSLIPGLLHPIRYYYVQIQRRRPGRSHHLTLCETCNVRWTTLGTDQCKVCQYNNQALPVNLLPIYLTLHDITTQDQISQVLYQVKKYQHCLVHCSPICVEICAPELENAVKHGMWNMGIMK